MNGALLFLQIGTTVEALLKRELGVRGIPVCLEGAHLLALLSLAAGAGVRRRGRPGLPIDVQRMLLAQCTQDASLQADAALIKQSGRHQTSCRTEGHLRNLLSGTRRLSEKGVTAWHMGEDPPPGTPGWLTRSTGLARPAVSAALAKLAAAGLVRSELARSNEGADKRDGRMRIYRLTESGEFQAVQCVALFESIGDSLSKLLGREGMKSIVRLHDLLTASPILDVPSALMLEMLAGQNRSLWARRAASAVDAKKKRR
jgi:DNA-binding transcriptional ArsR family regulator